MQENRDPAIKLFGLEIPVSSGDGKSDSGDVDEAQKERVMEKVSDIAQQDDTAPSSNEETTNSEAPPDSNVNPKTPSIKEEISKSQVSDPEKEPNEAATSEEKTLKKPDKILPCPRCNSMDTKFCYYNNYNVSQPRHFCKACQRYWTAGGIIRNVPVGAGRRKSKNSASNYRHISISEALQEADLDVPNGSTHPSLKTNGRVLNFSHDAPTCESMSSILNLADKNALNGTLNGFHKCHGVLIPGKSGEHGGDCSGGSSVTVSNSMEEKGKIPQEPLVRNITSFPAQMPCLSGPGIMWPYSWTSAVPPPNFYSPGFPMSFHPTAYWNCSIPTPWNIPWLSPQSPSNQYSSSSGPSSLLGKHSRDGKMLKPDGSEGEEQPIQNTITGHILVPKTLRIDDPAEAAKSSIWATLGIKNESISGGRMFNGFQSKKDEKNYVAEPSPVLRANPAALSRSLNFQESV